MELHRTTAVLIDLRETMQLHKSSAKRFLEFLERTSPNLSSSLDLIQRSQDIILRLEYYDLTSITLVDQQRNLLNLVIL
jgi:hypothetical protein